MIKGTRYCDRCNKEIVNCIIDSRGFQFLRKKYALNWSNNNWEQMDLCQDCYYSLEKWFVNKESKV